MATLTENRTAKACKLADVLREHGADSATAACLGHDGWVMVAALAGTLPPSVETRQMVVSMLRHAPVPA